MLAVLAQLRVEHYGYTLRKALADDGLEIEESTLYPLLRRLETQGLLVSEWREEDKRNKRFYRLSKDGKADPQTVAGGVARDGRIVGSDLAGGKSMNLFNRYLQAVGQGYCPRRVATTSLRNCGSISFRRSRIGKKNWGVL